jgi:hypothetical protein
VIATGVSVAEVIGATRPWAPSTSCCSRRAPTTSAWPRARTRCWPRSTRSSRRPRRRASWTSSRRSGSSAPGRQPAAVRRGGHGHRT